MPNSAHSSLLPLAIGLGSILALILGLLFDAYKRKHRHKSRSTGASAFGWMLLFLTSGRIPPPPPESQIEQDLQARNNRNESAGEDHER
jgi:hypothetical protein